MGKKVLGILETGYRATIEEQDDTILWLSSMFKGAGLDLTLLLRANAVNYMVRGQDASGLRFGELEVAHPPEIDRDVEALLEKGVAVRYVSEDVVQRGIADSDLVEGVKPVSKRDVPGLLDQFDQVWHW